MSNVRMTTYRTTTEQTLHMGNNV